MNFQLILLHEAGLRQELANVLSLIALQLQNLAIFGMFDHSAIASKLLKKEIQAVSTAHAVNRYKDMLPSCKF